MDKRLVIGGIRLLGAVAVVMGAEFFTLGTGSSGIVRVAFSPNGSLLALTASDGLIQIWAVGP